MGQRRFLTIWLLATGALAVLTGALASIRHGLEIKNGGLSVVLSDAGCLGGSTVGSGPNATDCSRTEWRYTHWWVWPLALLVVGLAVGVIVVLVRASSHRREPSPWEPRQS